MIKILLIILLALTLLHTVMSQDDFTVTLADNDDVTILPTDNFTSQDDETIASPADVTIESRGSSDEAAVELGMLFDDYYKYLLYINPIQASWVSYITT